VLKTASWAVLKKIQFKSENPTLGSSILELTIEKAPL
tara:strand:+ start:361 stop:471 length:111 start_codon:yes stop_codon:yes gene_type:complete